MCVCSVYLCAPTPRTVSDGNVFLAQGAANAKALRWAYTRLSGTLMEPLGSQCGRSRMSKGESVRDEVGSKEGVGECGRSDQRGS